MIRFALLTLLSLTPCLAAGAQTWEMNTYADFLKGTFAGVSLTRDGRLQLAPRLDPLFTSDQPVIWSVARAADGTLYAATGHRGRLYRITPNGDSELLWTAPEPEIFAVVLDARGRLFAATSPKGKVYLIENGQATEYFDPGATYIWSLAFGRQGALFVGTGDQGRVFRVARAGQGELYYDTGQSNVTALAIDASGRLLAGTEPNGILYRITHQDRAFVLYDANLPEIHSLIARPDGVVYASALGGSVAKGVAAATAGLAASAAGSIAHTSVTISAAQGGVKIKPPATKPKPAAPTVSATPALPMIEIPGIEKSAIFKIHPDNTVEKMWSSTEENAYGLLAGDARILLSTDQRGRVYKVTPDGLVTLLLQTGEEEAMELLAAGDGLLVATSNMGRIYRISHDTAARGTYTAPVHDAARASRWGVLRWTLAGGARGGVQFQTRSGNSARPDKTWSDWSEPLTDASGSAIPSPNARYVQWRCVLASATDAPPVLDSVTLAYLPRNSAPKVTGITVSSKTQPKSERNSTTPKTASTSPYSITVTASGKAGPSTVSGTSTKNLSKSANDRLQITWQTEDPDGDKLVYSLYFRGEDEREWKLLKDELTEASYKIDSDALADGKYNFRVVASDRLVNPASAARQGAYTSGPVLLDHTPPLLTAGEPETSPGSATVTVQAADAASALKQCEYSLDAGPWAPLAPLDGIVDSPRESFAVRLEKLPPGEHLLVVRAYDSAGNAGLVKVVLH